MSSGSTIVIGGGGGGPSSTGDATAIAKAIEAETGDNLSWGTSSIDGRTLIARSTSDNDAVTITEQDGITAVSDGSQFIPAGISKAAFDVEVLGYVGELTTGSYSRAALIAMIPTAAKLLSMAVYVKTGTGTFNQGGGSLTLETGAQLVRNINTGYMSDFTLTVDAASTVVIDLEGTA